MYICHVITGPVKTSNFLLSLQDSPCVTISLVQSLKTLVFHLQILSFMTLFSNHCLRVREKIAVAIIADAQNILSLGILDQPPHFFPKFLKNTMNPKYFPIT